MDLQHILLDNILNLWVGDRIVFDFSNCPFFEPSIQRCILDKCGREFPFWDNCHQCSYSFRDFAPVEKPVVKAKRCFGFSWENPECVECYGRGMKNKGKSCYSFYDKPKHERNALRHRKRPGKIQDLIRIQKSLKGWNKAGFKSLYGDDTDDDE